MVSSGSAAVEGEEEKGTIPRRTKSSAVSVPVLSKQQAVTCSVWLVGEVWGFGGGWGSVGLVGW